ncbi:MAG: hypothetical protein LBL59_08685 [Xanthomonadaceae bacterium]|jgi:hypothetical protein|nr:hypothetical protein [Xanthomonadaceae bacterium]
MSSLSLKGSPQGRRLAAEAVLAEAGWRANERQSALNTGDQADLAAVNMQGAAAEAAANRDLQAQQTNAQLAHQERQGQASRDSARELAMIARRPEITSAADGTLGIISGEGSFQPVTGPDGQAIRGPRQSAVPATDRLKAYNERYKTIMEGFGTAEEKQAALAQMGQDPLLQGQPSTEQTVAQGVPPAGAVIDGYRFKGGDPSNKDNWEKVNG